MAKERKIRNILIVCCISLVVFIFLQSLPQPVSDDSYRGPDTALMFDTISQIVSDYSGEIGVAVIVNSRDTVTVNDESIYPMMSVFKLHQAIAVCNDNGGRGISLDSVVTVRRDELDSNTWSPMMKDHPESIIHLRVRDLLRYTLTVSDNNASNLMFERMVSTVTTDSLIATIIPRSSFRIVYAESDMASDHDKAYSNYTSPLGAAILMDRLFTDNLISHDKQHFICQTLGECVTGKNRIVAPLLNQKGVSVAHKTGSGYTNEYGLLVAHNDVAFITLPDGTHYTLSVFVKDFSGDESEASEAIARISVAVYEILTRTE